MSAIPATTDLAPPAPHYDVARVRADFPILAQKIRGELLRSRHEVDLHTAPPGELGKFENLNRLLMDEMSGMSGSPIPEHDWLLLIDDDVLLPRDFLALGVWAWSYASDTIAWRDERFRG